jgi:hypothetical protein
LKIEKMPGIRPQDLKQFKDNWGVFDEPQAQDSPARRFPRLSPLHRVAADYRARARQGYRAMAPEMMHGQRILSIWIIYFVDPIAVWRDSRCDVNAPVRITVAPTRRTRSDPLPLTARSRRPGDGAEELRSRKRLGQ